MCQEFYADLAPVGPLEEMLVDQIVSLAWRLRRARTAESGEIALSVDGGWWQRKCQDLKLTTMFWGMDEDPVFAMRDSSFGNRYLENRLKEVRDAVEMEGELTEAAIQTVILHGKPFSLRKNLQELRSRLQQNPDGLDAGTVRAKQKE